MARRTILIADPDVGVVKSLIGVLKETYEVIAVKDGSRALEQSVTKYPDLILFERHCPLIGATQFARILRSNPRTEEIPLVILSDVPLSVQSMPGFLQGVLVKPLNLDEVRAHIAAVFRKLDALEEVGADDGAVSGSLDQISMPDLLQIFSVNRRSGCVQLTHPTERVVAEVYLHDGRIEEALVAGARGDKALYRLLGWHGGRFSFQPGRRAPSLSLSSSTDSLLMEGMRQMDELERLSPELPGRDARLERLVANDALPEGLHPVTADIAALVEFYPRVGDLVDKAKPPDLEVYLALRSLLGAGILRAVESGKAPQARALLTQDEALDLRGRLRRVGVAAAYLNAPKVAVLAPDLADLRLLAAGLSLLPGWRSGHLEQVLRTGCGSLGSITLDGNLAVQLYALSLEPRLLPFFFGLSAGTVAGIVVGTKQFAVAQGVAVLLENERRAGVLVVRRQGEPKAELAERRAEVEVTGFDADARGIVRGVLTQVAGREALRGGQL